MVKEGDLDAMLSQVDSMSDIEYQKLLTQADEMDKDLERMLGFTSLTKNDSFVGDFREDKVKMEKWEIRFAKDYPKIHGQTSGRLVSISLMTIDESTSKEFIEYDSTMSDGSKYPLPDGDYMLLVFLGNLGIPFSTLRKQNIENLNKYMSGLGKIFELVISRKGCSKEEAMKYSMGIDYMKTSTGEPCQGWYVTSEGTQGVVGVLDIAEHIIDELKEQQCHLCGDESFDAGWKAGLEKAIEIISEATDIRLKDVACGRYEDMR